MHVPGKDRPATPAYTPQHHRCVGGRMRITEDGLEAYLRDEPLTQQHTTIVAPGVLFDQMPPFPGGQPGTKPHKTEELAEKPFVGHDLEGKVPSRTPLPQAGPNPYGTRFFVGNEFPGIMSFDKKGQPTWWSRFPEAGENPENIKEMRISIASHLPAFATGNTPQAKDLQEMQKQAFNDQPVEDVFNEVSAQVKAEVEQFAQTYGHAMGIHITVNMDDPGAHLTIMGYDRGDDTLLGFASFPPSVSDWDVLDKLGHHPAYMMVNNDFTAKSNAKEIHELISHEFSHVMGIFHPHDYGQLRMSKREAITATMMAYTDLKMDAFRHVITDEAGNPVKDADGNLQYAHTGPDIGVLDYGMRHWMTDTPPLGNVTQPDPQLPDYDGYLGVYDLQAHLDYAKEINKETLVYTREQLLPMVPMLNTGKHTVLKGTPDGDDFLDTNIGYTSKIRDNETGIEQHFSLLEGHMERVLGRGGNNTIILSRAHDQTIEPGPGHNVVQILHGETQGQKTIISEGRDTLLLSEAFLENASLKAKPGADGITLQGKDVMLNLQGNGLEAIRVINAEGRELFKLETNDLTAAELNKQLFEKAPWRDSPLSNPPTPSSQAGNDWQNYVIKQRDMKTAASQSP